MLKLSHAPAFLEVIAIPTDDHRQRVAVGVPAHPEITLTVDLPGFMPVDAPPDLFAQLAAPMQLVPRAPKGGSASSKDARNHAAFTVRDQTFTAPPKRGIFSRRPRFLLAAFECDRPSGALLYPLRLSLPEVSPTRSVPMAIYLATPTPERPELDTLADGRHDPRDPVHFPEGLGHLTFRTVAPYAWRGDAFVPTGWFVDATFAAPAEANLDLVLPDQGRGGG